MANTTDDNLRLLGGWFSPFVMRVRVTLNIKSLQYEHLEEKRFIDPKSDLLLQSNPVYKKIPVLLHSDKPICESRIIVQYIDEVWNSGPSILPANAYDRAMARFWAAYIDDKCTAPLIKTVADEDPAVQEASLKEVEASLVILEDELQKSCREGKGLYFGGEKIGFVDITFGSLLGPFRVKETMIGRKVIVEDKYPYLVKWAERFESDPNVKDLVPDTKELYEYAIGLKLKRRLAAAAARANKGI